IFEAGFWIIPAALVVGIIAAIVVYRWARRRQMLTGQQFPALSVGFALIVALPVLADLVAGSPITWSLPELKGFNFQGGMSVLPEFVALLLALSIYTAAFIAEIVRSGVQAVSHGQTEAARALGLRPTMTTRLVILPQALRVIVPPLTSQYLNLTKNSTLGVIIAYPDLVSVFAGTVQNQTGQAGECVAITMAVYLVISLLISGFMNWYNRPTALRERWGSATITASGRHVALPDEPPPRLEVGVLGWLRKNLFSSVPNAILTILGLYLLYLIIPPVVNWAIINAHWESGTNNAECTRTDIPAGACW